MTTLVEAVRSLRAPRLGYIIGLGVALLFAVIAISNRNHPRSSLDKQSLAQLQFQSGETNVRAYSAPSAGARPVAYAQKTEIVDRSDSPNDVPGAAEGRRIVRTASIEMVVDHPADIAERITQLAEKFGGYLVSADTGGQNATAGTLLVRVPVAQFDEARAEIRKLALRVEAEKFEAKDVTEEYVDQYASMRNLRTEESQYLAMLQQAHTVNDMFFVAQKLTEVRGRIEKAEAEFNAMSHQAETVRDRHFSQN